MSSPSRFNSRSTPDLLDTRYREVKSRPGPYGQATESGHDGLLQPSSRHLPTLSELTGRGRAVQLRRSLSLQPIADSADFSTSHASASLQRISANLKTLNSYVSSIQFQPDRLRQEIRREVKKAQCHDFELDKSLEKILYAMYKTKNERSEEKDRISDEDIFRKSVRQAIQFGKSATSTNAFGVLRKKYRNQDGLGNTAASIKAGAGALAYAGASAIQKLNAGFLRQRSDEGSSKEKPVSDMSASQGRHAKTSPASQGAERTDGGVNIDELFADPRNSLSTSSSHENANPDVSLHVERKSPAEILSGLSVIVEENGADAALAVMDIDEAVLLSEFKGSVRQLMDMMQTQTQTQPSAEAEAHSPAR